MTLNKLSKSTEEIQDIVGSLIIGSGDANVTYDDTNDQLSIDVSTLTNEQVEDIVGSLLTSGNATNLTYNDSTNTLTVDVDESAISHDNISGVSSSDHHTRYADSEARTAVSGNVDAAELTGSGSSGQYLQTNGSNASWSSLSQSVEAFESNVNYTKYTTTSTGTFVDITGSGKLYGAHISGETGGYDQSVDVDVTIDGVTEYFSSPEIGISSATYYPVLIPTIKFDSSLKIVISLSSNIYLEESVCYVVQ